MTTALIFNVLLSAVVFAAIIGMLAWSITTQRVEGAARIPLAARRRRRATAPSFVGRTVEDRA